MSTKAQQNLNMGCKPSPLLICAMLRKLVLEAFSNPLSPIPVCAVHAVSVFNVYDSFSDVGEIRVYRRADFQSGSRVLKKVF